MPHPVDVRLGQRIRDLRRVQGVTQQKLADAVGIRFQQLQRYELGINRVSASRLWEIARALDVKISFLLDEAADEIPRTQRDLLEVMGRPETAELIRAYFDAPEEGRKSVLKLLRSMAKPSDG